MLDIPVCYSTCSFQWYSPIFFCRKAWQVHRILATSIEIMASLLRIISKHKNATDITSGFEMSQHSPSIKGKVWKRFSLADLNFIMHPVEDKFFFVMNGKKKRERDEHIGLVQGME